MKGDRMRGSQEERGGEDARREEMGETRRR